MLKIETKPKIERAAAGRISSQLIFLKNRFCMLKLKLNNDIYQFIENENNFFDLPAV